MKKISIVIVITALLGLGGCMDRPLNNPVDPTEHDVHLPLPSFSPSPGAYTVAKQITISCSVSGAQIRYTTGGGEPSSSSTLYTRPFTISNNTLIRAKAFKAGWGASPTNTVHYYINLPACSAPTYSVSGGTYYTPFMLSLYCTTQGAEIHYTTTGGEPSMSSPKYTSPLSVTSPMTVRARAFRPNYLPSVFSSQSYDLTVMPVVFDHSEGIYTNAFLLQLSCDTPGAVIRYTTTGPEPTLSSPQYESPLSVTSTMTVRAKAFMTPYLPGATTSTLYSLAPGYPGFDPPGGMYSSPQSVTIIPAGQNEVICYTLDGSVPNETSPQYATPIYITTNTMIRARGYRTGWNPGYVASANYVIVGR